MLWPLSALAVLAGPGLALAQDRPNEDALFGGPEAPSDAGVEAATDGGVTAAPSRDAEQMSGPAVVNQFDSGKSLNDPLKIGGMLYVRALASWGLNQSADRIPLSVPSLLDVYLDARPSEQVRAFAQGRLTYDPTQPSNASTSPIPGLGAGGTVSNPSVALDQLWLRFDILRKVFLTIGRQKAKWGVGHLWNPTDFLNAQKRDPLAPFDLRPGINAVKVHVPLEKLGWNFYGYGLLDNSGPASTIGQLGGALRAEIVLGPAELSLGGVWVKGRRPRYSVDVSSPIGPIDVYAEAAFRSGRDFEVYRLHNDPPTGPDDFFTRRLDGIQVQATAGISFSRNYTESNTLTVGAEYFYNPAGAASPYIYLPELYGGTFTPFYAGQHYLGIFALAPGLPNFPWITLNFANLLNLSDPSGIARLDVFLRVMAFMQIEAFVSVNYGVVGGEFRFGGEFPKVQLEGGGTVGPFSVPVPAASTGLGLRLSI